MGNAIFLLGLRSGELVRALAHQTTVLDVVQRIGAPVAAVIAAAARSRTAAPFVGKQHFGPVIIERRGVPICEARIADDVDPLRPPRVGYVEDDAVARTCACGEFLRRENSDVVALIGDAGFLTVVDQFAALAEPGEAAALFVGEHRRAGDNPRGGGVGDGNFDDVDAEQRGANVARDIADAAGQLLGLAHARRA